MNGDKEITKRSFGGRPSVFTSNVRTVIFESLRAGKSYAGACIAAGISPVSLFRHRGAHKHFDKRVREARAEGKAKPNAAPGHATMIDSWGNVVPNTEVVCDEAQRQGLIKLRDRMLKDPEYRARCDAILEA